uniref:Uncharacterized protein n=1 Tax=Schistocephalus solidus TaxID=70667 RepID=A0A0V0J6X7_SCHSO
MYRSSEDVQCPAQASPDAPVIINWFLIVAFSLLLLALTINCCTSSEAQNIPVFELISPLLRQTSGTRAFAFIHWLCSFASMSVESFDIVYLTGACIQKEEYPYNGWRRLLHLSSARRFSLNLILQFIHYQGRLEGLSANVLKSSKLTNVGVPM